MKLLLHEEGSGRSCRMATIPVKCNPWEETHMMCEQGSLVVLGMCQMSLHRYLLLTLDEVKANGKIHANNLN